jgi:hypothetical protein
VETTTQQQNACQYLISSAFCCCCDEGNQFSLLHLGPLIAHIDDDDNVGGKQDVTTTKILAWKRERMFDGDSISCHHEYQLIHNHILRKGFFSSCCSSIFLLDLPLCCVFHFLNKFLLDFRLPFILAHSWLLHLRPPSSAPWGFSIFGSVIDINLLRRYEYEIVKLNFSEDSRRHRRRSLLLFSEGNKSDGGFIE